MITILLLISAYFDLKERIIPNSVPISLVLLGLLKAVYYDVSIWYPLLMGGTMYIVLMLSTVTLEMITKKQAMGGGDIKLISALTFCVDPNICFGALLIGLIGALLSLVWIKFKHKNKNILLPLAPYIAGGFILSNLLSNLIGGM